MKTSLRIITISALICLLVFALPFAGLSASPAESAESADLTIPDKPAASPDPFRTASETLTAKLGFPISLDAFTGSLYPAEAGDSLSDAELPAGAYILLATDSARGIFQLTGKGYEFSLFFDSVGLVSVPEGGKVLLDRAVAVPEALFYEKYPDARGSVIALAFQDYWAILSEATGAEISQEINAPRQDGKPDDEDEGEDPDLIWDEIKAKD